MKNKDIGKWYEKYEDYPDTYIKTIVNHEEQKLKTFTMYKDSLK